MASDAGRTGRTGDRAADDRHVAGSRGSREIRNATEIRNVTGVAVRAAHAAGRIALRGFRSDDLRVELKTDRHDPVTPYDRAAEERIRATLLAAFPDCTIVGEEGGVQRGSGALTWYVDPIDGTANFARGIPMWAVSIAAERDGELVSAVIFDPVHDHLFWADDRGAFLSSGADAADGAGGADGVGSATRTTPLRSRGSSDPGAATVALNFPLARDLVHLPDLALAQFAEVTRAFAQVRGLGSTCITLCWIAAGWIDATVSFETHPWDVAAGALLIRRAGGAFVGYRDGAAVPEATAHLAPHYFAAVGGADFPILREIMLTQSARPLPGTRDGGAQ